MPSHANLYTMLAYPDVPVQMAALQVLGLVDDQDAVRAVESVIVHPGRHEDVRVEAVNVLGAMVNPEADEARLRILRDAADLLLPGWDKNIIEPVRYDSRFAQYVRDVAKDSEALVATTHNDKYVLKLKEQFLGNNLQTQVDDAMAARLKKGGVDFDPDKIKFQKQNSSVNKESIHSSSDAYNVDFRGLFPEIVRMVSTTVADFISM